jgi:SEP domain
VLEGFPFRPYFSKEAQSVLSDILDGFFPYDLKTKFPDGVPLKIKDFTTDMHNVKQVSKDQNVFDKQQLEEKFIKQFPENVIKDGNLVPIKEGIAGKLGVMSKVQESVELVSPLCKLDESFTLRIRTEAGKPLLMIKTSCNEKLESVYALCKKYR